MKQCANCRGRNPSDSSSCSYCGEEFFDLAPQLANMLFPFESGRFRDVYFIAEGSFGGVYHCYDLKNRREVAVKVVKEKILKNPRLMELFKRECEFAGSVGEEHLTKTLEFRIAGDKAYTIMEFAEGVSLAEYIAGLEVLKLSDFSKIVRQICSGLHIFHYHGLVHCDLKPLNIVINPSNLKLKIVDFGLAHFHGFENVLNIGTVAGTRGYMSPEQEAGSRALGAASDIYSLGVILFELLCGKTPEKVSNPQKKRSGPVLKRNASASFLAFEKNFNSAAEVMPEIVLGKNPVLSAESSGHVSELDEAIARCLSREPQSRFKSAADLAEKIDAFSKSPLRIVGLYWPKICEGRKASTAIGAEIGSEARTLISQDTATTGLSSQTGVTGVRTSGVNSLEPSTGSSENATSATAVASSEKLHASLSDRPASFVTTVSGESGGREIPKKVTAALVFLMILAVASYSYVISRVVPEPGTLKRSTGFVSAEPFTGVPKPAIPAGPPDPAKLFRPSDDHAALEEKAKKLHSSGGYEEAIKIYDHLIGSSGPDVDLLNFLGNALNNVGRYEEAAGCYDKIFSLATSECWALHEKSKSMRKLGKADAAIKCLDGILALRPADRFIMHEKAALLQKAGYFEESVRLYSSMLSSDPADAVVLISLGESSIEARSYREALNYYDRAITLLPKDRFLHYRAGYLCQNAGNYDNAIVQYDMALKYSDLEKSVSSDGGYTDSADFQKIAGREKKNRHVYDFRSPTDSEIWYLKAISFGKLGMNDESKKCYEQFMKADRK